MSDANDQNTPNDDFSQSIDEDSAGSAMDAASDGQSAEMKDKIEDDGSTQPTQTKSKPKSAAARPSSTSQSHYDLDTLVGRLEKKLSEINDVLLEKEGMQMQYVFRTGIREEYYRRWKAESNFFVGLAARLQKRIDREKKRLGQTG